MRLRFAVRGVLLVGAWVAFIVVFLVTGVSNRMLGAFLAGMAVAWLWPRIWRWSDDEPYGRMQKGAPSRQPEG